MPYSAWRPERICGQLTNQRLKLDCIEHLDASDHAALA
jgi:hypothetical protein